MEKRNVPKAISLLGIFTFSQKALMSRRAVLIHVQVRNYVGTLPRVFLHKMNTTTPAALAWKERICFPAFCHGEFWQKV